MAGLLDFIKTPEGQGLLSAAFAGMAGAQRGAPWNNVGRAGVAGLLGYNNTMGRLQDEERNGILNEQARLQVDEIKRKNADAQASREILKGIYGNQGLPQSPQQSGYSIGSASPFQFEQRQSSVPAKASQYETYKGIGDKMASAGLVDQAQQYYGMAEKFRPKYSTTPQQMMVNGRLSNVLVGEDGTTQVLGYGVKPEMVSTDVGDRVVWSDKNSLQPGQYFGKGQTPDSVASNETTRRGQNMTDSRARELNAITREGQNTQLVNDPNHGIVLVNKATKQATPAIATASGQPLMSENAIAAKKQSGQLASGISMARELIPKATNSGVGSMVDSTMGFFGGSTDGAVAATQLKTLSGWMTSNVPRMQGPQSDKDTMLYRQMAAEVGDEKIPAQRRLKALDTLEELHRKYADVNMGAVQQPNEFQRQGTFDADKERRYQEWKARQGK